MQPISWNDIRVLNKALINETRPPKTDVSLAIRYAIRVTPKVLLSHEISWVIVFADRCPEPRRTRTKMYLAGYLTTH
jgi:hypothetical protein